MSSPNEVEKKDKWGFLRKYLTKKVIAVVFVLCVVRCV